MTRSVAVIVPIYNELASIVPFYERARPVLEALPDVSWELVFVNDGSSDGSLARILQLRDREPRVKVVSLSRNFGYHPGLLAGLTVVSADLYVMIDVDCEDPPELLKDFLGAIDGGADVAYGIRSARIEPTVVTFFRRIFYHLNRSIADSDIVVWMGEFAMITRQVRDAILVPRTTYLFLRAEIAYTGFVRVGIPYLRAARTAGVSHYNLFGMTRYAVSGFLAGSTFPLRLILYVSVGLAIAFPIFAAALSLGAGAAGTAASIVTFYFALFALSTIALYLARTYKNGVARPLFIIDKSKTYL